MFFTRTKRGANRVAKQIEAAGFGSAAIHGNKSQGARQKALERFRQNQVSVLVATDVASRGIDIDGISHVINYDMPVEPESYMHRIGRTARAGMTGFAISFCTSEEQKELRAIERLVGKQITVEESDTSVQFDEKGKSNTDDSAKPRRPSSRSWRSNRGNDNQTAKPNQNRQSKNGKRRRKSGGHERRPVTIK